MHQGHHYANEIVNSENENQWCPFRPSAADLEAIGKDVAEIPDVQRKLLANDADLKFRDRVAHQYQIAGSKVVFQIANDLPEPLCGVGLFQPGAQHSGIGRISSGLGTPHVETNPDFLGIMVAFQTPDGQRVDFLGINNPTAPTDNHREFMSVLYATGESAGTDVPFVGKLGAHELVNLGAQQTEFGFALAHRMGAIKAGETLLHLTKQTLPTALSSTAYQRYWTGIVEVGGTGGKFTFVPTCEENYLPGFHGGPRHLTDDWKNRQVRGDIEFQLFWIPFLSEEKTPTKALTQPWQEDHKQLVGIMVFPQTDLDSEDARLWAILATEMGANPGNWVADKLNSIQQPASEFGAARKIAYQKSQEGRGALEPSFYRSVFSTAQITPELAQELKRRHDTKLKAGHICQAP